MKSTRTEENEYPKLKIINDETIIVLFTSRDRGVIINSLDDDFPLGVNNFEWNESIFRTYNGTVTLEN